MKGPDISALHVVLVKLACVKFTAFWLPCRKIGFHVQNGLPCQKQKSPSNFQKKTSICYTLFITPVHQFTSKLTPHISPTFKASGFVACFSLISEYVLKRSPSLYRPLHCILRASPLGHLSLVSSQIGHPLASIDRCFSPIARLPQLGHILAPLGRLPFLGLFPSRLGLLPAVLHVLATPQLHCQRGPGAPAREPPGSPKASFYQPGRF